MKNAYIPPPPSRVEKSHKHMTPTYNFKDFTADGLTQMPAGYLFRCECGVWFRSFTPIGAISYNKWGRVRWYHLKDQQRINDFREVEAEDAV